MFRPSRHLKIEFGCVVTYAKMWLLFLKVRRPNALRSFIERRVNHTRMQWQSNCDGILNFFLIPRLSMHFIQKQLYYCRRRPSSLLRLL